MELAVFVFLLFCFTVYASESSGVSVCKTPPWPVSVKFGISDLGPRSRPSPGNGSNPQGYGLTVVLGGERFTPRIELSPELRVSEVRYKSSCSRAKPGDCRLEPSYHPLTEILAGGVYSRGQLQSNSTNTPVVPIDEKDIASNDTLELGGKILSNFIFQSDTQQLSNRTRGLETLVSSYIGLGIGSTLLDRLYDNGLIASKSWSFFAGWLSPLDSLRMALDGALIMGGYDVRFLGTSEFIEFPMQEIKANSSTCLFPIEVSSVNWLGRSATININPEGPQLTTFTACIDPGSSLLEFPFSLWETLANNSYSSGLSASWNVSHDVKRVNPILPIDQQGLEYEAYGRQVDFASETDQSVIDLAMTIEITDGPSITISHNQILQRLRMIYNNGTVAGVDRSYNGQGLGADGKQSNFTVVVSDIKTAIITYPDPKAGENPIFGLPFLSAAYLMANFETKTFGLAPVGPVISEKRAITPFLPPQCAPTEKKIGIKVIAPAAAGSFLFVVFLTVVVYRTQSQYKISLFTSPFISRVRISEKKAQEMDATQPFEHEIEGRPISELPGNQNFISILRSKSVGSKRSIHELP